MAAEGDLALVGLGPARHRGDLHVADAVEVFAEPGEHVALRDADVIDVEHELDVGRADAVEDLDAALDLRIEVAGHVALVDRLDAGWSARVPAPSAPLP